MVYIKYSMRFRISIQHRYRVNFRTILEAGEGVCFLLSQPELYYIILLC